jgi:hypothetical protein
MSRRIDILRGHNTDEPLPALLTVILRISPVISHELKNLHQPSFGGLMRLPSGVQCFSSGKRKLSFPPFRLNRGRRLPGFLSKQ